MRRDRVVGVVDGDEVRHRRRPARRRSRPLCARPSSRRSRSSRHGPRRGRPGRRSPAPPPSSRASRGRCRGRPGSACRSRGRTTSWSCGPRARRSAPRRPVPSAPREATCSASPTGRRRRGSPRARRELTARSEPLATETRSWPRYGRVRRSEAETSPGRKASGAGSCCGCWTSVVLQARARGRRSASPAARCQSWPIPSRTVNGASEPTVSCRRPSASMTRTRATGAGPSVVPV